MTRPPVFRAYHALPGELAVDNFAGGGGASTGIEAALGRPVDIAINHSPEAIAVHAANHPETRHYCENIWEVDPVEAAAGRPVGLAWFSPDCTHFSRAKGTVPLKKEIRGLAWVVIRWAKSVRPRVILLENVEEFQTWGPLTDENRPDPERMGETFRAWLAELSALGYRVEYRTLVAADYGTPTTRRRLFLVARCDGGPIVWPEATHGAGRAHCYAKTFAERWRGVKGHPYEQGFDVRLVPEALHKPLHWRRPRLVFVNSMSDLFHESVPFEFIDKVFAVMALCPQHTFQVLTKRAKRMREYVNAPFRSNRVLDAMISLSPDAGVWSWNTWLGQLSHVWLGVTCEDQRAADERIPHLLATPAAVRWVSVEPLLEPVSLTDIIVPAGILKPLCGLLWEPVGGGGKGVTVKGPRGPRLDWVVVGGESGPGARPCEVEWIRSVLRQCREASVPAFCKQLGATPYEDGVLLRGGSETYVHDRAGADPSEWPDDLRVREHPRAAAEPRP